MIQIVLQSVILMLLALLLVMLMVNRRLQIRFAELTNKRFKTHDDFMGSQIGINRLQAMHNDMVKDHFARLEPPEARRSWENRPN